MFGAFPIKGSVYKKIKKDEKEEKHQFILSNTQRINNHLKILEPRYINSFFLHILFVYTITMIYIHKITSTPFWNFFFSIFL